MKKEYMKPAMRAVKLRHRQNLLVGSPNSMDGKTLGSYSGGDDTVNDGEEDTLF